MFVFGVLHILPYCRAESLNKNYEKQVLTQYHAILIERDKMFCAKCSHNKSSPLRYERDIVPYGITANLSCSLLAGFLVLTLVCCDHLPNVCVQCSILGKWVG